MSKISTNLTRLAVSKNAHTKLALIYSKNLRVLAKMPSDYTYRYVHCYYTQTHHQDSVAGSVIQASGMVVFDDVLRTVAW